ncbi:MAG: M28 family peptidase [Anaerolineae bacterium]|nr:M28 family peptidase [Anaerolineae bacterium]
MESFTSARSIYLPHLLAAATVLVAFVAYPLAGRVSAGIAAFLVIVSLSSELLELGFRDNLFRRLVPKAPSQNVVATVQPAGEHRRDLVFIGHIDSHRTPLIFSTPRWVSVYQAFTTVVFVLFLILLILYILGAVTQWAWIWPASIPSAVGALLLAAMCLQADRTPYSAGANDNATGAGLVLALGDHLQAAPLQHTRVWLVCTGCEEVQHYGAIDFFRRHRAEFHNPVAVVFELMGCAGPAWLTREGIVVPFHADRDLVALAEQLSSAHPEWGAYATQITGGNTEMADALRAGIPAITFMGLGPNGETPYWHQAEDTFDKMDPEVMERAYAFVWAFVQATDAGVVQPG